MELEIGINNELEGDARVVQLVGDVEKVLLVINLKHYSVSAPRHITISRALARGVANLSSLQPTGEVCPDNDIVEKGTPRKSKGGKWGKLCLGSPESMRRSRALLGYSSILSRVRGPLVGSNAVVVRSS